MIRIKCNAPTMVADSRPETPQSGRTTVKRRRRCTKCKHKFNTIEVLYNGSTTDSKSVSVGSIPTTSAKPKRKPKRRDPFDDPAYLESLSDDELEALIGGSNYE